MSPRDVALDALRLLADWRMAWIIRCALGHTDSSADEREQCREALAPHLDSDEPCVAQALRLAISLCSGEDVDLVDMLNDHAPMDAGEPVRTIH